MIGLLCVKTTKVECWLVFKNGGFCIRPSGQIYWSSARWTSDTVTMLWMVKLWFSVMSACSDSTINVFLKHVTSAAEVSLRCGTCCSHLFLHASLETPVLWNTPHSLDTFWYEVYIMCRKCTKGSRIPGESVYCLSEHLLLLIIPSVGLRLHRRRYVPVFAYAGCFSCQEFEAYNV